MLAQAAALKTPACEAPKTQDLVGIQHAIFQAKLGLSEGGIPIGAALVNSEGVVLGVGRNRRVQLGSATRHGETDCLEIRLPASVYKGCTMYTTLSPCAMCAGAMVLFAIKRCVMAENDTSVGRKKGGERILHDHGIEVVNLSLESCKDLMNAFISKNPEIWHEDCGDE